MCESYSRSLLRVSVAQICQALGWDSVQLSACHLLTDVLQRYLQQLGRGCHRYSELCEYRAGCGRAASGQSRVTPPVFPSLSQRLRDVRACPPTPRSGVFSASDAPRVPLPPGNSSHRCGASPSSTNFPPPAGTPVPALSSTPSLTSSLVGNQQRSFPHRLVFAACRTTSRMPRSLLYFGPSPPLPANYYN